MKIITLMENTSKDTSLISKHGLSIYIETSNHKLLFDLGPDDAYLHNAKNLGVDLTEVDTVIISHGHSDHGGALSGFFEVNSKAKVYIRSQAFEPHYTKGLFFRKFIGLDSELAGNDRLIITGDTFRIDSELLIFSDVNGSFDTKSNSALLKKTANGYIQDDFLHEQNLIVTTENRAVLFSGCSHRGIVNILRAAQIHQPAIQAVFGGFHLYNNTKKTTEPQEVVQQLAKELSAFDVFFYTGHCTGIKAFESMHDSMGDKLRYFYTGSIIEL